MNREKIHCAWVGNYSAVTAGANAQYSGQRWHVKKRKWASQNSWPRKQWDSFKDWKGWWDTSSQG